MNRLWVRLALAFGLVTLAAVLTAGVLANYQVSTDFRRYVFRNQMMQSTMLPALTDYYAGHGSWAGVETVLQTMRGPGLGMGRGAGQGNGRGLGMGGGTFTLANAAGQIIYTATGEGIGRQLSPSDLSGAVPVTLQGQTVGYITGSGPAGLTTEAQTFLGQINRSLVQAGLVAGLLGLALGVLMARGLTAPLSRLAAATRRIAHGHLSERVPVQGAVELANLASAFNDMAAHLEQAELLRRNLVADVAHELRTPLSVVQGNLRAILDDVYPLDKTEIASIYDETLVLNRLISDLRELAQAEAGQLSLQLETVAITPLITGMADRLRELAREKNITLTASLPANLPPVQADADRVRQVLHNFLANALRHTPAGGRVKITVAPQPGRLQISVSDTGPGITPADLPHVFDRFWRADKSRAREQGGSGLGLAISRQLIQAHGGQVGAESQPGQGSRFWFTLPLA